MDHNPFQKPPYFDWSMDRWKVAIIVIIFFLLLISTLFDADWRQGIVVNPGPQMSDAAAVETEALPEPTAEAAAITPTAEEVAVEEPSSAPLPLTLSSLGPNAVVSSAGIASLSGTGHPVRRIEVRDQQLLQTDLGQVPIPARAEDLLGVATVDERGLWTVPLDDVLAPGQHIITIREVDEEGNILSVSPPVVVVVLSSGEQGPVSLATPVIRFPAPAARLRRGPTVFMGRGLPGMRVRLYLDDREAAEGMVNMREEWRLAPEEDLAPGVYVARVAALDPQGEIIAESPPVAFSVVEPVEGMAPLQLDRAPAASLDSLEKPG
jgi:hypothetical protein